MPATFAFDISNNLCTTSCWTRSRARWNSRCQRYFSASLYLGSSSVHVCSILSLASRSSTVRTATNNFSVVACRALSSWRVLLASTSYLEGRPDSRNWWDAANHFALHERVNDGTICKDGHLLDLSFCFKRVDIRALEYLAFRFLLQVLEELAFIYKPMFKVSILKVRCHLQLVDLGSIHVDDR